MEVGEGCGPHADLSQLQLSSIDIVVTSPGLVVKKFSKVAGGIKIYLETPQKQFTTPPPPPQENISSLAYMERKISIVYVGGLILGGGGGGGCHPTLPPTPPSHADRWVMHAIYCW